MKPFFPARIIKNHAKAAMKGKFFKAFAICVVPSVIILAVTALVFLLMPGAVDSVNLIFSGNFESLEARMEYMNLVMNNYTWALNLISVLFSFLSLGASKLCLDLLRGKEVKIRGVFSYYNKWYIAILYPALSLLVSFTLSEMTTLLSDSGLSFEVVSVISLVGEFMYLIFTFKFMFVEYALADNDAEDFIGAVKASWNMVGINTVMNSILLALSFFGWFILSAMTGGIALIYVLPYLILASAALYEANRLYVQNMNNQPSEADSDNL